MNLLLSPDHPVDDVYVGLYYLDDPCADVLAHVDVHGGAVVAGAVHRQGRPNGLQQAALVDAGKDEAAVVQRLGTLGAGADANRREGATDRGEETRLLGQGPRVGDDRRRVHLQAVVVVESQRLVTDDKRVQLETALLQAHP